MVWVPDVGVPGLGLAQPANLCNAGLTQKLVLDLLVEYYSHDFTRIERVLDVIRELQVWTSNLGCGTASISNDG